MPSKVRHIRVPDDVWEGASARAHDDHTTASTVAVAALKEYWRTGTRVGVSSVPEVPANSPAAPVAPPQGQSAPMERSEAPGPRADPEPAPERKRRAPAGRAAAAPGPIADEAPAPLAAAHALAEQIGAPLKAASDLRPVKPLPEVTPGTVMFAEAGATPVVTYEVPPVPRTCPHKLNKGAWCKLCRMEA